MLDITHISHTSVYNEDWRKARLGKITASMFGCIIGKDIEKGIINQTGITYLEGLAGEIITQRPAQEEFFTNATNHGNAYEPEAIEYFANQLGMFPLRNSERGDSHRLIIHDEYSGCTPDALLSKESDVNKLFDTSGNFIKVTPLETKCPPVHHRYIKLFKCKTPHDLKIVEPKYYWQVITQMVFCGSINAYFGAYNPFFTVKGRLIEFKQLELMQDIKLFHNALSLATEELKRNIKLFS